MRVYRRPALVAGLVLMVALVAGGGPATAQDADCARSLWATPIETLDLPEGWSWNYLYPSDAGWEGYIEFRRPEEDQFGFFDHIHLGLKCRPDPQAAMDAGVRARSLFPDFQDLDAVQVGEGLIANDPTIQQSQAREGFVPLAMTSGEARAYIDAQTKHYRTLLQELGQD